MVWSAGAARTQPALPTLAPTALVEPTLVHAIAN
jgi:hypothetical protein